MAIIIELILTLKRLTICFRVVVRINGIARYKAADREHFETLYCLQANGGVAGRFGVGFRQNNEACSNILSWRPPHFSAALRRRHHRAADACANKDRFCVIDFFRYSQFCHSFSLEKYIRTWLNLHPFLFY